MGNQHSSRHETVEAGAGFYSLSGCRYSNALAINSAMCLGRAFVKSLI
jgi:hypothetical protein